MKWRVLLVSGAIAVFSACGGPSASADVGPFTLTATRSTDWNGKRLEATYIIDGHARVETSPWIPCNGFGGLGDEIRWGWESNAEGGQIAYAELYDPDGTSRPVRCPGPPRVTAYGGGEDAARLPATFSLGFGGAGASCERKPDAEEIRTYTVAPTSIEIPATPGTAASQEVVFSKEIREAAWPKWLAHTYTSVCLLGTGSYEFPNRECAEIFNPDFCATEYESFRYVLQGAKLKRVVTRTPRCSQARARRNQVRKALRTHRRPTLRRYYLQIAQPRFLGECR